jgi:hypothetical protein
MENNNIMQEQPTPAQPKVSTPMAIIIAGFLIMIGILLTNGSGINVSTKEKTLSEQVGVSKEKLTACLEETNYEELYTRTSTEADIVMKNIPQNQRGTPYSVIVGKNGIKTEVRGAYDKANVNKLIEEVLLGKVTVEYTGEIPLYREGDHIIGNPEAPIVIIEYSDLECPFCKRFGETMEEIVTESNGQVAWIYRHWVVHVAEGQYALPKAAAAECVAKLKGNDAFWKYINLIFGLMKTEEDTSGIDQL